jgi:hypothetical protein
MRSRAAMLGAAILCASAIAAYAQNPVPTPAAAQPSAGAAPSLAQSYARLPGPKPGPDTWIRSSPGPVVARAPDPLLGPNPGSDTRIPPSPPYQGNADNSPAAHPYSQHGTGPYPN